MHARNPAQIRTRGGYELLTNDVNNISEPGRRGRAARTAVPIRVLRADGIVQVTSACGPGVIHGDRLPADV